MRIIEIIELHIELAFIRLNRTGDDDAQEHLNQSIAT